MKLNEYQRSISDLGQRSHRFQNYNLFILEFLGSFETKVHMKNHVRMRMKIYTKELGHVNKMTAMLIYGENL